MGPPQTSRVQVPGLGAARTHEPKRSGQRARGPGRKPGPTVSHDPGTLGGSLHSFEPISSSEKGAGPGTSLTPHIHG